MAYNYTVIPARAGAEYPNHYFLAGYSPNTLRFTYNPTQIFPLDAATNGTQINFLMSGSPVGVYTVGDVIFLTNGTNAVYGSILRIIDLGGTFTLIVEFGTTFTIPGATVWHGVRSNSYVLFEFYEPSTFLVFASVKRIPQNTGRLDLDLSGSALGEYDNFHDFNFDVVNYLNPTSQKRFKIRYTEFVGGANLGTTTLPETFDLLQQGLPIKGNNFNSSNYVDFLPNTTTPAKWLNIFAVAGLPVPVWSGLPHYVNFIYPDSVTGLSISVPSGTIALDDTQKEGVNFLNITESMFAGGTEFCTEIEGDGFPQYYREISGNWRFGGLDSFTFQITEPMLLPEFEGLFGATIANTGFYYGTTIGGLTNYPYSTWQALVNAAPVGGYIKLVNTSGLADAPFILKYATLTPTPATWNVSLPFDQTEVGVDLVVPFFFEVQLQSTIAGTWAGIRTAGAVSDDYSLFPYDLSTGGGVSALNSAIAALAEPQAYVVHFWSDSHTAKSATFSTTTATRERVLHLSEDQDYKYAFGTQGNAQNYNGLTDYHYINPGGFPQALVDKGATFTAFVVFDYVTSPDSLLFSTSTWPSPPQWYKGLRLDLIGNTANIAWQTGAGATLDLQRALVSIDPTAKNCVMFEFTGDTVTGVKIWVNKRDSNLQMIFNNNGGGAWSIQNGQDDAAIAAYSVLAGASNLHQGMIKQIQFIDRVLTTDEREKAFNKRTLKDIVADADFFFAADMSVGPPIPQAGTPAFTVTTGGAPTTTTFLP